MNFSTPRIGSQPWDAVRTKLDQSLPFANMRDTPYYRDAVWEQFSKQEYERRYRALRAKMAEHRLDAMIVPGGPSHWSFGAGVLWLLLIVVLVLAAAALVKYLRSDRSE